MSIARMNVRTSAQLTAFSAIHVISIGVSKYMCNGQAFRKRLYTYLGVQQFIHALYFLV